MGSASGVGDPTGDDAAKIGGEGEQRQHEDAGDDAREGQQLVNVHAGSFDRVNLFGDFHGAEFGTDTCAYAAANYQGGDDRTRFVNDGEDDGGGKQGLGAELDEAVAAFEREDCADCGAGHCDHRQGISSRLRRAGGEVRGLQRGVGCGAEHLPDEHA